jgi:hypothetical protein
MTLRIDLEAQMDLMVVVVVVMDGQGDHTKLPREAGQWLQTARWSIEDPGNSPSITTSLR